MNTFKVKKGCKPPFDEGIPIPNWEFEPDKPKCKLIGTDGNVFAIIGQVSKALKQAGLPERAKEFTEKAFGSGSYDEVLAMLSDYVDVL